MQLTDTAHRAAHRRALAMSCTCAPRHARLRVPARRSADDPVTAGTVARCCRCPGTAGEIDVHVGLLVVHPERERCDGRLDALVVALDCEESIRVPAAPSLSHWHLQAHRWSQLVAAGRMSVAPCDLAGWLRASTRALQSTAGLGGAHRECQVRSCSMPANETSDDEPRRLPAALRLVVRRYLRQGRARPWLAIVSLALPGVGNIFVRFVPPLAIAHLLALLAHDAQASAGELA